MTIGSNTSTIAMINLVMTAADGSGGVWQDPVQTIPLGMNNDPAGFVARIQAGLPLVNNLRVLFNEYSFNPDGSLHPQMEAFLAAAAAAGYQLTMVFGSGAAQDIGSGLPGYPRLSNPAAFAALEANFTALETGWTRLMDWMDDHPAVKSAVYGWELMNESAAYRETVRRNGSADGLTLADFVELYANHAIALSDLIQARAAGKVLVGGWGYNGDFLTLNDTLINGQTALDVLRAGVGADLVWSAHLYPGWMDTDEATSPADLVAMLEDIYAPVAGDDVLITEINADGQIDNPAQAPDYADYYAASYDWFADNGIGLGWYPGVQTGASHLLYLEANGNLSYRHQHSVAHAMNAFALGRDPAGTGGNDQITVSPFNVRLRNEAYQIAAGEALFDTTGKAGFAFGYSGNDTLTGTDISNDFLYGGKGNDRAVGGAGDDFLFGDTGVDSLFGGNGIDALYGGGGRDTLDGGAGADILMGGEGNDTYIVDNASDAIVEYAGEGTVDLVQTALAIWTLGAELERLEFLGTGKFTGTGNALSNRVTGGLDGDRLSGLAGDDSLEGMGGQDTLLGGAGADTLNGGGGTDLVNYDGAGAGVIANLTAPTFGAAAGEAEGDVFVQVENLRGSGFGDQLTGSIVANSLWGMDGDDTLAGGRGGDRLYGGQGADSFLFAFGDDKDRVMDFEDGIDTIFLQGFAGIASEADVLALAVQDGADVLIDFGAGDTLRVVDTALAALSGDLVILP